MAAQKPDLDRLGFFKETSYTTIGDPYKIGKPFEFKTGVVKGRQMYTEISHPKTGLKAGYFEDFKRVMEGESLDDPVKRLRRQKIESSKHKVTNREFYPANYTQKPSGLGGVFGLFDSKIPHFSAETSKQKIPSEPPNMRCSPPKKGTGSGFADVFINKFPEYRGDKYDKRLDTLHAMNENHKRCVAGRPAFAIGGKIEEFGPNPFKGESMNKLRPKQAVKPPLYQPFRPSNPTKNAGGCMAGCLNPWPTHTNEKYVDPYKRDSKKNKGGVFLPSSCSKSTRTESIIQRNVMKALNANNFHQVTSVY